MDKIYEHLIKSITHLKSFQNTFINRNNYTNTLDYDVYLDNFNKLSNIVSNPPVEMHKQLYDLKSRQMILADILEYIFIARGIFFIPDGIKSPAKKKKNKGLFIKSILYFVNLLMCYEFMTVDDKLRVEFLNNLGIALPETKLETKNQELLRFSGKIGLTAANSDADSELNKYFDKLLPKTAGGLWHELLVYIFLLRNDLGYIVPLLLNQKFFSGSDIIVPPDFLLITKEKDIYGIEVGKKKEIQSGSFSLMTNIPTATIDTINSRCSDRCPICNKWILFCDKVISDYSNLDININQKQIKCLDICKENNNDTRTDRCPFTRQQVLDGECPYSKYHRDEITEQFDHKYVDGHRYHYKCILTKLSNEEQVKLKSNGGDVTAIKTHYPYYAGLDNLFTNPIR